MQHIRADLINQNMPADASDESLEDALAVAEMDRRHVACEHPFMLVAQELVRQILDREFTAAYTCSPHPTTVKVSCLAQVSFVRERLVRAKAVQVASDSLAVLIGPVDRQWKLGSSF